MERRRFRSATVFLNMFAVVISLINAEHNDDFKEELLVKPFQSGHVYFHFQFTTKWDSPMDNPNTFQHYRLFPKALGDVLATYQVQELHLSQTQGLWRYEKWGYPVEDAATGAELWVWFKPTIRLTDIDKTWSELVNALAGLFCSSLNFMDSKVTLAPRWTFRPRGLSLPGYDQFDRFIRYAALPHEVVCTENLTPWKKLLPCDSKAGLATLFNSFKLFDAPFHSLGVHVRPVCRDSECKTSSVELIQNLAVVLDAPAFSQGYQDWSLKRAFGHALMSKCPLASSSKVFIDTSSNLNVTKFDLKLIPTKIHNFMYGADQREYVEYDLDKETGGGRVLNLAVKYKQQHSYDNIEPPPVYATRFVTGYGLERGGVTCKIHSRLSQNVTVIYMDSVPWFLRVFFKSLTIEINGHSVIPYKLHYVPGKDRKQPYHLEVVFRLWANSVAKINFQFERAYLRWTEYPPDANHGFYVNSAVISLVLPDATQYTSPPMQSSLLESVVNNETASSGFFLRLRTEILLVSLPTPDFSMPYNVICLACTVVAIGFGSLHNLFTRRFSLHDPKKQTGLLSKVKAFFRRLKSGKKEEECAKGDSENVSETAAEEIKEGDEIRDKLEIGAGDCS